MNKPQKGFTLAELLIALALLGIIAAFTIPKVLQASSTQEASAKIKETVSTLEQAWTSQRSTNNLTYGSPLYNTIVPSMNSVSASNTVAVNAVGGPLVGAVGHPFADITSAPGCLDGWVQFGNGVVISGLSDGAVLDTKPALDSSHGPAANYIICIDYNGSANPNRVGQDVFIGNFNQYGGFSAVPANENYALKSFRWGNTTDAATGNILDNAGAMVVGTVNTQFGSFNPGAGVPSAVVGVRLISS